MNYNHKNLDHMANYMLLCLNVIIKIFIENFLENSFIINNIEWKEIFDI